MCPAWVLLTVCSLVLGTTGGPSQDSCSQVLHSGVKPGFPKTIKTDNPDVLRAARHSAERFNNCSNDVFLFKESRVRRALVQVVKGLKFMLDVDIGRTTCKKTGRPSLDDCDFQTNRTLQRVPNLTPGSSPTGEQGGGSPPGLPRRPPQLPKAHLQAVSAAGLGQGRAFTQFRSHSGEGAAQRQSACLARTRSWVHSLQE
ncbi:cystatin-F isoform X1 [Camelus ferus]|uniref:Cystatin-F isoform X1 n=1 Tax=Camelus ferus TaxID=419612 RepID=A0A8B8RKB7_CAMFR|nr:cystatin-F isoform X1 [Camelus ferus]